MNNFLQQYIWLHAYRLRRSRVLYLQLWLHFLQSLLSLSMFIQLWCLEKKQIMINSRFCNFHDILSFTVDSIFISSFYISVCFLDPGDSQGPNHCSQALLFICCFHYFPYSSVIKGKNILFQDVRSVPPPLLDCLERTRRGH